MVTWTLIVAELVLQCRSAITVVLHIGIRPIVMTSQHTYRTVKLNGTGHVVYQGKSEYCQAIGIMT
jgi:hypothetical protein